MISELQGIIAGAIALVLIGLTVWLTHELDSVAYGHLETQFADYKTQSQSDHNIALKALNDALAAQQKAREATEKFNDQISTSLTAVQSDAAAAHRDADFAQRLLAAAKNAGTVAPGAAVPAPQGGPGAANPTLALGDRRPGDLAGLTTGAVAECRNAIERLAALQIELSPQL